MDMESELASHKNIKLGNNSLPKTARLIYFFVHQMTGIVIIQIRAQNQELELMKRR